MAEKEKKPDAAPTGDKKPAAKAEAAPAAAPAAAAKAGAGGLLTKTPVLLGGAMIIEAVVLFAGFKFISGGAKNANAADLTTPVKAVEGADGDKSATTDDTTTAEVPLLEARFPNKRSGRAFLYDIKIVLSVKKESADKVKAIVTEHDALIQDRVRTIIAETDPEKLGGGAEPGLETLRRQVKYQLDEIVGDGLIDDVLIPQCIPFPADY
jgi:flagellar basal body-associated protein FliL